MPIRMLSLQKDEITCVDKDVDSISGMHDHYGTGMQFFSKKFSTTLLGIYAKVIKIVFQKVHKHYSQ